ncbi:MAG: glycosyltransferase family 2 protein [Clostridia bacterium]|nr:glycosyltransferase family 2 protein [Clostridia bacterium]
MLIEQREGVPSYEIMEYKPQQCEYVLLIPVINEGAKIKSELERAQNAGISKFVDIIILDGGSSDGSVEEALLKSLDINTLLIKKSAGKQGTQLRMGFDFISKRNYKGIITIDGNNKDSIENVPDFIEKLKEGFDYIQGSRFIKGGRAINTPLSRLIAVKLLHAPIISLKAHHRFTDTTNNFRGYSVRYINDNRVNPLRDIFVSYELLAYLSTRATRIGYTATEIPVTREYPINVKTPTKISPIKGNYELLKILFLNLFGHYDP